MHPYHRKFDDVTKRTLYQGVDYLTLTSRKDGTLSPPWLLRIVPLKLGCLPLGNVRKNLPHATLATHEGTNIRVILARLSKLENVILELIDLRECSLVILKQLLSFLNCNLKGLGYLILLCSINNGEVQSLSRTTLPFLNFFNRHAINQSGC